MGAKVKKGMCIAIQAHSQAENTQPFYLQVTDFYRSESAAKSTTLWVEGNLFEQFEEDRIDYEEIRQSGDTITKVDIKNDRTAAQFRLLSAMQCVPINTGHFSVMYVFM